MQIRRFVPEDAAAVSGMIKKALAAGKSAGFTKKFIEMNIASHSPELMLERAKQGHMYIAELDGEAVGCGMIAPFWGSETESILLSVFILPECLRSGIGKFIIAALEQDEYGRRADRIEVQVSAAGAAFYRALGYECKKTDSKAESGKKDLMIRMEKYPPRKKTEP